MEEDDEDSDYNEDSHDDDDSDKASVAHSAPTSTTSATQLSTTSVKPKRPKYPSDLKSIKCTWPDCGKAFNRPARLTAHMRSHTNDRPFKCDFPGCDKDYLEEKHLKQHITASHSDERNYPCQEPGCDKKFLTSSRLRRHQKVHEGKERFRCDPCDKSFRKHQTLQRHIRTAHLNLPAFKCGEEGCDACFDTSASLKRHNAREHSELKYWCDECPDEDGEGKLGFKTLEQLRQHVKKAHISCTFCNRSFSDRDKMDAHIEAEHSKATLNERKSVVCTYEGCTKSFVKPANLKTHIRSVHEGYRFICGEIDVSSTADLSHWPPSEGCGDSFTTKGNLEKHIRHVHLNIPRPLVNKTEKQSSDMLGELTLTGDATRRTIQCSWVGCPLKFALHTEMQAHLQTHFDHNLGQTLEQDFGMAAVPVMTTMATMPPASTVPSMPMPAMTSMSAMAPMPAMVGMPNMAGMPDAGMYEFNLTSPYASQPVTPGLGVEWGYPTPEPVQSGEYFQEAAEREWQQDEAEMGRLIESHELDSFIDPALARM